MNEISIKSLSKEMLAEAKKLKTGKIIFVYKDGTSIRMETEDGDDPYVWREKKKKWQPMRFPEDF